MGNRPEPDHKPSEGVSPDFVAEAPAVKDGGKRGGEELPLAQGQR